MKLDKLISYFIFSFLLLPFGIILFQFRPNQLPEFSELWWALKNSTMQSFFSALFSVVLGFVAALGLLGMNKRLRSISEVLALAPNFFPPLFILISILNIFDPFPSGLIGITIVHSFINFGLVAVLFARQIEIKIGKYAELALVEGASRWHFLSRVVIPILKPEAIRFFLFVFAICFSSFSIPLIVGGGRGTTLEVLVYEKIRLSSNWGEAFFLSAIQTFVIFIISYFSSKEVKVARSNEELNFSLMKQPFAWILIYAAAFVFFIGYIQGLFEGFHVFSTLYELREAILWATLGSFVISFLAGALILILLMLTALVSDNQKLKIFLNGFVSPSTSLVCFAFLILSPNNAFWPFLKIPLAFVTISFCTLYRMGWAEENDAIVQQMNVARVLGASEWQIFLTVKLPQVLPLAGLLSGLGAIWAAGDFAVSRILAHSDLTLAMMSETLLSSYRIHQASLLSFFVIIIALLNFAIFYWGSHVISRKSEI